MGNKIVIDTADKEYSFYNKRDEHLFDIILNPADLDIVKRYDTVVDTLNNLDIKDDDVDAFYKADVMMKEQIDYLLNAPLSGKVFAQCNPFSPLESGKLFVEEVLEAVASVIEKEMNVRTKKVNSRIQKYTAKYHK